MCLQRLQNEGPKISATDSDRICSLQWDFGEKIRVFRNEGRYSME